MQELVQEPVRAMFDQPFQIINVFKMKQPRASTKTIGMLDYIPSSFPQIQDAIECTLWDLQASKDCVQRKDFLLMHANGSKLDVTRDLSEWHFKTEVYWRSKPAAEQEAKKQVGARYELGRKKVQSWQRLDKVNPL